MSSYRLFKLLAGQVNECPVCSTLLKDGVYGIGLFIDNRIYIVGVNPPMTCCGDARKIVELFSSEDDARLHAEAALATVERGGQESLTLYEFTPLPVPSTAIQ